MNPRLTDAVPVDVAERLIPTERIKEAAPVAAAINSTSTTLMRPIVAVPEALAVIVLGICRTYDAVAVLVAAKLRPTDRM